MAKSTDTQYDGVLLLKRSELASEMPKTNKEIEKVAKAMWKDYLLFSKKITNKRNVGLSRQDTLRLPVQLPPCLPGDQINYQIYTTHIQEPMESSI